MAGIQLKSDVTSIRVLEITSRIIAYIVCIGLLMGAAIITIQSFFDLLRFSLDKAIQDGLFVLILLEMFYVVRSFIKYGSINVGLVINVGIIAVVKELIFQLENISLQLASGFAMLLITMSILYYIEFKVFSHYKEAKKEKYLTKQL